jgi:hypothetical protein
MVSLHSEYEITALVSSRIEVPFANICLKISNLLWDLLLLRLEFRIRINLIYILPH